MIAEEQNVTAVFEAYVKEDKIVNAKKSQDVTYKWKGTASIPSEEYRPCIEKVRSKLLRFSRTQPLHNLKRLTAVVKEVHELTTHEFQAFTNAGQCRASTI